MPVLHRLPCPKLQQIVYISLGHLVDSKKEVGGLELDVVLVRRPVLRVSSGAGRWWSPLRQRVPMLIARFTFRNY